MPSGGAPGGELIDQLVELGDLVLEGGGGGGQNRRRFRVGGGGGGGGGGRRQPLVDADVELRGGVGQNLETGTWPPRKQSAV